MSGVHSSSCHLKYTKCPFSVFTSPASRSVQMMYVYTSVRRRTIHAAATCTRLNLYVTRPVALSYIPTAAFYTCCNIVSTPTSSRARCLISNNALVYSNDSSNGLIRRICGQFLNFLLLFCSVPNAASTVVVMCVIVEARV